LRIPPSSFPTIRHAAWHYDATGSEKAKQTSAKKELHCHGLIGLYSRSWRMLYDLAVAYRIYPKVSKPTPVFSQDKRRLAALCLRSFKQAIGSLRVKIYAILDGCPPDYETLFTQHFPTPDLELINVNSLGNRATFGRQIDLLLDQQESDLVYFAEDDYFYLPGALEALVRFARDNEDAHFVSPYDHPDAYQLALHPKRQELRVFGDRHWRTSASTCLTFLTPKQVLRRTAGVFRTYQKTNLDVSLWMALTKQTVLSPARFLRCCRQRIQYGGYIAQAWRYNGLRLLWGPRYKLWIPLPTVATHMEAAHLAPAVNWRQLLTAASAMES